MIIIINIIVELIYAYFTYIQSNSMKKYIFYIEFLVEGVGLFDWPLLLHPLNTIQVVSDGILQCVLSTFKICEGS